MDEDEKGKRRRGAPAGNQNALKHGFYAKGMTTLEVEDLDACMAEGLADEIAMLRVFVRRVFTQARQVKDPELAINYLRALGMSAVDLAALMRTERLIGGGKSSAHEALLKALTAVQQELKLS